MLVLVTVALVVLVIARRLADRTALSTSLLPVFGRSLLGEAAVVGSRAMRLGAPFAPRRGRLFS